MNWAEMIHKRNLIRLMADKSGVTDAQRAEMIRRGVLRPGDTTSAPFNPLLMVVRAGPIYGRAGKRKQKEMRKWTRAQWEEALKGAPRAYPPTFTPRPIDKPPVDAGAAQTPPIPSYLSRVEAAALNEAWTRTADLTQGLLAETEREIKEEVAKAIVEKKTAREVAGALRYRSRNYGRDFERIARTEIQGAHNEGQAFLAESIDGENAQVERIPESGACGRCRELLDKNVFTLTELRENGTNAGRKRAEWLPTVFPLHPNCKCDLVYTK